jgi:hypothetical protein
VTLDRLCGPGISRGWGAAQAARIDDSAVVRCHIGWGRQDVRDDRVLGRVGLPVVIVQPHRRSWSFFGALVPETCPVGCATTGGVFFCAHGLIARARVLLSLQGVTLVCGRDAGLASNLSVRSPRASGDLSYRAPVDRLHRPAGARAREGIQYRAAQKVNYRGIDYAQPPKSCAKRHCLWHYPRRSAEGRQPGQRREPAMTQPKIETRITLRVPIEFMPWLEKWSREQWTSIPVVVREFIVEGVRRRLEAEGAETVAPRRNDGPFHYRRTPRNAAARAARDREQAEHGAA